MRKAFLLVAAAAAATAVTTTSAQAAPPTLISCTDRDAVIYLDTTYNCDGPPR